MTEYKRPKVDDVAQQIVEAVQRRLSFPLDVDFRKPSSNFERRAKLTGVSASQGRVLFSIREGDMNYTQTTWANDCAREYLQLKQKSEKVLKDETKYSPPNAWGEISVLYPSSTVARMTLSQLIPPAVREYLKHPVDDFSAVTTWVNRMNADDWAEQLVEVYREKTRLKKRKRKAESNKPSKIKKSNVDDEETGDDESMSDSPEALGIPQAMEISPLARIAPPNPQQYLEFISRSNQRALASAMPSFVEPSQQPIPAPAVQSSIPAPPPHPSPSALPLIEALLAGPITSEVRLQLLQHLVQQTPELGGVQIAVSHLGNTPSSSADQRIAWIGSILKAALAK